MTGREHDPRDAWTPPLARTDGDALLSAPEALLKGALESPVPAVAVFGPRRPPFEPLFRMAADPAAQAALDRNGLRLEASVDAVRSISLAAIESAAGRGAIALLPNDQLDRGMGALERLARSCAGPVALVLEDNPHLSPATCPRRICWRLRMPTLEPWDLESLRRSVGLALRMSSAAGVPVGIVVHNTMLRSWATLAMRPNRVVTMLDAVEPEALVVDDSDPLRDLRRDEFNHAWFMPSPGERERYGIIAIGPCVHATLHMLDATGFTGRVPVFRLGASAPIDESALERFLERCEHAIVVEPRPGSTAPRVVGLAQRIRRAHGHAAQVWWTELPPVEGHARVRLEPNEGTRSSTLVRKMIHLLDELRPSKDPHAVLAPDVELDGVAAPPRDEHLGLASARMAATEAALDAIEALGARLPEQGDAPRHAVLAGGPEPARAGSTVIEVWDRRRWSIEGGAAVRHGVRTGSRVFVVCDLAADEEPDVERLAEACTPGDARRLPRMVRVDVNDRDAVVASIVEAADEGGVSIIIARDGPPARRDINVLERDLIEVDRLGYLPMQRFIWPVSAACDLRDPPLATLIDQGLERGADPLRATAEIVRVTPEPGQGWRLRVEPLLEQVELERERPVAMAEAARQASSLPAPTPVHATQGVWRAHLAGWRGDPPGVAVQMLCEAGRSMGYRVEAVHHATPVGPGRRSWAQVLFTRAASSDDLPMPTRIPFGEGDVLIGMDPVESLRALGPDPYLRVGAAGRTRACVNTGAFPDQLREPFESAAAALEPSIERALGAPADLALDMARRVRHAFLNDRVLDVAMLGASFQLGLVPVTVEALEAAARRMEQRGYARSLEALRFGRLVASERTELRESASDRERAQDMMRRMEFEARVYGNPRSRRLSRRVVALLRPYLRALEPLAGVDGGQPLHDLVLAFRRCVIWGGGDYAKRFGDAIVALAERERGVELMPLTAACVLPLAELSLIRDFPYLCVMTVGDEHRRRVREWLGEVRSRGDHVSRRYLYRVDVAVPGRRWKAEFKGSDWPARVVELVMPLVPLSWRGRMGQDAREAGYRFVADAAASESTYDQWVRSAQELHARALDGSIREMSAGDIDALRPGSLAPRDA